MIAENVIAELMANVSSEVRRKDGKFSMTFVGISQEIRDAAWRIREMQKSAFAKKKESPGKSPNLADPATPKPATSCEECFHPYGTMPCYGPPPCPHYKG